MNIILEIFSGPGMAIVLDGLEVLFRFAPIWLPVVLLVAFWKVWVGYVRAEKIASMEWVMLEVVLPERNDRSPLAMELVLNNLLSGAGEGNIVEKYWKGGVRSWASLELVSIDGSVHFIIRIPKGSRRVFESQIYAQYPNVEIHEVPDYTDAVSFKEGEMDLWAANIQLTKPDPYPIKTYVDYGLDKAQKEEEIVDPITPVIEWLGSLGKGEQAWIQIIVRQHKKEDRKKWGPFNWPLFEFDKGVLKFPVEDKWKDDVEKEIEEIVKKRKIKGGDEEGKTVQLTTLEKDVIAALERSISKHAFDVGIRVMYLGEKEVFNKANLGGLLGTFKQYSTNHLNGFKPSKMKTGFDAEYRQDPFGWRIRKRKVKLLDAYKRRSYFHPPHKYKHMILNAEELATIYHFPGSVVTTPTFKRLDARKAEPPTNLPT